MSTTGSTNSVMGRFVSPGGDDLIQLVNSGGGLLFRVDSFGTMYTMDGSGPGANIFWVTGQSGVPAGITVLNMKSNTNGDNAIDISLRLKGSDGVGFNIDLDRRNSVAKSLSFTLENPQGNFVIGLMQIRLDGGVGFNNFQNSTNPTGMLFQPAAVPASFFDGLTGPSLGIARTGGTSADAAPLIQLGVNTTQSVDIFQIYQINGVTKIFSINSAGALVLNSGAAPTVGASQIGLGTTTATSAATGANGAPPAQVAGYWIVNVGGTAQKIPFYN